MTAASPQWQPLSALPTVAQDIQAQLANAGELHDQLLQALDRPHVLDDALIARVVRQNTDELELLVVYREQLGLWYQAQPTSAQFLELDRLTHAIDRWQQLLEKVRALADELGAGTIDKVLAKPDHQLAVELLAGKLKFPDGKHSDPALAAAARAQIATVIDLQMQPLIQAHADDLTVLGAMQPVMAGFRQLMDTAGREEMEALLHRFSGLDRFAQVLGRIAAGIQSGAIKVPM